MTFLICGEMFMLFLLDPCNLDFTPTYTWDYIGEEISLFESLLESNFLEKQEVVFVERLILYEAFHVRFFI